MTSYTNHLHTIGADVGGSHIAVEIIDKPSNETTHSFRAPLNSNGSCLCVIKSLASAINQQLATNTDAVTIGIAMPGPFDYNNGISKIAGLGGKFNKTFGLNFTDTLNNFLHVPEGSSVHFSNDAHCFAAGAGLLHQLNTGNIVCITLGTGFGSAFLVDGELVEHHPNLPSSGAFYNQEFQQSIADDYFSTRWFLKEYYDKTGKEISSVKELAMLANEKEVQEIFQLFGKNLSEFLIPHLHIFQCNTLVIGGNISKAFTYFGESFYQSLKEQKINLKVIIDDNTEHTIITGAAILAKKRMKNTISNKLLRKTRQPLLPLKSKENTHQYNCFPAFELMNETINSGFDILADKILQHKKIIIDGFSGVLWNELRTNLNKAFLKAGKKALWYDITACLKPEEEIDSLIAANLNGNDPVFGKRFEGTITDFFDEQLLQQIQPDEEADMCIVYGTGASLCNWNGFLVYADVPKNEIQYRMRANTVTNLGTSKQFESTQMYKRFYFVDWVVLNKHKQNLLQKIDIIIDEQRIDEITWMTGNDFKNALQEMSIHALRARPWFEAGVWGGNWMKKNLPGIEQNEINYAWSFELITPENGIVFSYNSFLFEVSFDYLLYFNNRNILGKAAKRFGTEFPIRFDFLDTFDGGNLSIQCHPRTDYIQKQFGENFTQDETYYILDCKEDAIVYLGFQETIEPTNFKKALLEVQQQNKTLDADNYVQSFPAHKHDLFLIPNGTIHASGKNNLVLEISSTPYIFTFKMYDWQRLDLTGKPRPISIEHAFKNLDFERKGKWVEENLISHPIVIDEQKDYKRIQLPTHSEHFYAIERHEFMNEISIETNDQCHICMLVEGDAVEIITGNRTQQFHYAETIVVPAAANKYIVKNKSNKLAMLVTAFVKDECC